MQFNNIITSDEIHPICDLMDSLGISNESIERFRDESFLSAFREPVYRTVGKTLKEFFRINSFELIQSKLADIFDLDWYPEKAEKNIREALSKVYLSDEDYGEIIFAAFETTM